MGVGASWECGLTMQVDIVSLFPAMFDALSRYGVSGRAIDNGLVSLAMHNPRDYTDDNYQSVDDRPYGGGPGMVMLVAPLQKALAAAEARQRAASGKDKARVIYLSPQGAPLTQAKVMELAGLSALTLLCGRYEGVDERLIDAEVDEELSLGDYVISGGEMAAMVLLDAIIRQLPGALGDAASAEQDSFMQAGLLDCPHYTRPAEYNGRAVPAVLLSGDHRAIRRWRHQQSLLRTRQRRPDLFQQRVLDQEDRDLLAEFDSQ